MKKIILAIMGVFVAGSIFAQKAERTSLELRGETFKKAPEVLTKAPGDVIYYENFDGNALPAGWDTLSIVSHWEFGANPSHDGQAYITYGTDAEQPKDAWLISPTIFISDTVAHPVLMFDVSTSYYWLVSNNTDDVTIVVSTDGGNTWPDTIWKEDDSTMVINSLMPWPYESFSWYTAKVNLSSYINDSIKIAFHYKSNDGVGGHNGVSFYMDNFLVRDDYTEDLFMEASLPMSYGVYWYGVQAKNQAWPYTVFRTLDLNYGATDLNSVNLNVTVTDENNNEVFNQTANQFTSGATSLASHVRDTMEIQQTFQADTTAEHQYTITFNATTDPADQYDANNSSTWTLLMTDTTYGRTSELTSTLSVADYTGGGNGDALGTMLLIKNPDKAGKITFYNSTATTPGTSVQAIVYELDDQGNWLEKVSSDPYDLTEADTGKWISIPLNQDGFSENLSAQSWYLVALKFYFNPDNGEDIRVGIKDNFGSLYSQNDDEGYKNSVNLSLGGTWYYITSGVPSFLLELGENGGGGSLVENVSMNSLNVYPNPATTNIYVENNTGATINIYNLVGEKVMEITNADKNAVVNVSGLNAGTYIVKVIEGNTVKTAKVNVVK